jgi:L-alanine-DL-glutamate epimerase-like enolase superfamily enzyme
MLSVIETEIALIAIPFRFGFRHALAERDVGDGVVVTVRDAEGRKGFGECTPREYVSGETSRTVVESLARRASRFMSRAFASFEELTEELAREARELPRAEHAAFCSLELAWLDLGGQVFGRSAGAPLGPLHSAFIEYSGVVSASGVEEAVKKCTVMREMGVAQVKVKVGADGHSDREVLAAVRETLGDAASLRVDANGAWDAKTALERLSELEPYRLEGCEQPCAGEDLEGMAWLTARSPVPVIADESLVSLEDAQALIDRKACNVFNVRISKCGGLLGAGRIRDLARQAGIDTMLGAHVGETAILAAAGRQFATRTEGLRFAEGSYGKLLLEADVSDSMDLGPGGTGPAIQGNGLGLDVDLERIAPYVVSRMKLFA